MRRGRREPAVRFVPFVGGNSLLGIRPDGLFSPEHFAQPPNVLGRPAGLLVHGRLRIARHGSGASARRGDAVWPNAIRSDAARWPALSGSSLSGGRQRAARRCAIRLRAVRLQSARLRTPRVWRAAGLQRAAEQCPRLRIAGLFGSARCCACRWKCHAAAGARACADCQRRFCFSSRWLLARPNDGAASGHRRSARPPGQNGSQAQNPYGRTV